MLHVFTFCDIILLFLYYSCANSMSSLTVFLSYVTDAITGLLTVLLDGENGNAYNIASKLCITTIAGIAHTLVESYPEKGLKVIFDLPTEAEAKGFSLIENAVLSSEKLEALGWEPKTDLVTGLKNVVEEQIELKV